jgi:TPR repeat protein
VRRAIALEPRASEHRWSAAATYLALSQFDHAQAEAQAASRLAETEDQQRAATEMLRLVEAARASHVEREAADRQAAEASRQASDVQARVAACGSGEAQACTSLVPWLDARCGEKDGGACGMLGFLHQSGRGVTQDSGRSARFFALACEAGESRACVAFAVMQARGDGVPRDEASALATLERLCGGGMRDACTQLALVLASRQRRTDLPRIRELLDGSCKAGDAAACDLVKTIPAH